MAKFRVTLRATSIEIIEAESFWPQSRYRPDMAATSKSLRSPAPSVALPPWTVAER